MVSRPTAPHAESGLLLLADISGYTSFLELVAVEHPGMMEPGGDEVAPAYPVISSMLDAVADRLAPLFTVAEFEGDAVFAYALDAATDGDGDAVLDLVRSAYRAFRERIAEAMILQKHDCQACVLMPNLELKFVVHHGPFVVQPIGGQLKLLGPAVNVAHRLLKNSVTEQTGRRAYVLMTDSARARLGLPPQIGAAHVERHAEAGMTSGVVLGVEPVQ